MLHLAQGRRKASNVGEPLLSPLVMNTMGRDAAKLLFRKGQLAMVAGGPGCLAADTVVRINRAGNGRRITLEDLHYKFHGGASKAGETWREDIHTDIQFMAADGTLRKTRIVDVWESGVKDTYTVTTASGKTIRGTDIHPFYTTEGWKKLGELSVGDKTYVNGGQKKGDFDKSRFRDAERAGLTFHPYARGIKRKRVATHRLIAEANANGIGYEEFVQRCKDGNVEGLEFADPATHDVHHLDHDHQNNSPDNLVIISRDEHKRHHSSTQARNVLYVATPEEIVSIEYYGKEMTYDLEVEDEQHNFVANDFVVHNTGKSALVQSIVQRGDGKGNKNKGIYFSADSDPFTMFTRAVAIEKGWSTHDVERGIQASPEYLDTIATQATENMWFDFTSELTPSRIMNQILAYAELTGEYPEFIVVDNLKNLDVSEGAGEEFQVLEENSTFLAELAGITGAAIIATHHVGGSYEDNSSVIPLSGVRGKVSKTPTLIATMRRNGADELWVSIVKNRGGVADASGGFYGLVKANFETMQFN